MSMIEPKKLKVAELKEELKIRGLETKGNKPELLERLEEALRSEQRVSESELTGNGDKEPEATLPLAEEAQAAHQVEPDPVNVAPNTSECDESIKGDSKECLEKAEVLTDEANVVLTEGQDVEAAVTSEQSVVKGGETVDDKAEGVECEATDTGDETVFPEDYQPTPDDEFEVMDAIGEDVDADDRKDNRRRERHAEKRRHSPERRRSRSPHHRRSRSPERKRSTEERSYHRSPSPALKVEPMESDDWLSATKCELDRYNCDINLTVGADGVTGTPMSSDGFAFMWAGARAMYGVKKGKIAFETKLVKETDVGHLPAEESSRHVVRVGWSTDATSTQLGEQQFSYGYDGAAKASTENKFEDYGQTFGVDDVITSYLDFDVEPIEMSFSKNGEDLGVCFKVEAASLVGHSLFPHALSKNVVFECNFGQREESWCPLKEGFTFLNNLCAEDKIRGSLPPVQKEDCEVVMMVGLPGCGKTHWANHEAVEHCEKKYNILGTNSILDKMKVMGLPRKKNYSGRWDVLIDKATKCLNRLLEVAPRKKRNYIIDQTNVYPTAQKRKIRPFEGFQRVAVVLVPTEEEYKSRCEKQEKEEGKEVPDSAVLEMKANFQLPEVGPLFDKVTYVELNKEEAEKLVEKYNKEGKAALPPAEKRSRGSHGDDRHSTSRYGPGFGGFRDSNRGNRGNFSRGQYQDRNFRGGYGRDYPSRGGRNDHYRGGYGADRGGYRSDRDRNSGSRGGYQSRDRYGDSSSSYRGRDNRGGSYGGAGGNWGSRQQGSWGPQGSWGSGSQGSWGSGSQQSGWGNQGHWGGQAYNNQGSSWGGQWGSGTSGQGNWGSQGSGSNYGWGGSTGGSWGSGQGSWGSYGYK